MWPWEHLATGYIVYSLGKRLFGYPAPGRAEVVVLAFATQLPDLIDKPLGWGTDILPGGVSLAHSYLVAIPAVAVVYLVTRELDEPQIGVAFAVGYLLHTPGDILTRYLLNGELIVGALAWPLVPAPQNGNRPVFDWTIELWYSYLETLQTPAGQAYLLLEITLVGGAVLVWLADRRSRRAAGSTRVILD